MANHTDQCNVCGRFDFETCNAPRKCPRKGLAPAAEPAPEPAATIPVKPNECRLSPPPQVDKEHQRVVAKAKGYTGDTCSDCGNLSMVRNGTCLKCDTCGGTSGCS